MDNRRHPVLTDNGIPAPLHAGYLYEHNAIFRRTWVSNPLGKIRSVAYK